MVSRFVTRETFTVKMDCDQKSTNRVHATSGFRAVAPSSISGSGFSAAEYAASPMLPVENDLDEFDGRRREDVVE